MPGGSRPGGPLRSATGAREGALLAPPVQHQQMPKHHRSTETSGARCRSCTRAWRHAALLGFVPSSPAGGVCGGHGAPQPSRWLNLDAHGAALCCGKLLGGQRGRVRGWRRGRRQRHGAQLHSRGDWRLEAGCAAADYGRRGGHSHLPGGALLWWEAGVFCWAGQRSAGHVGGGWAGREYRERM